MSAVVAAPRTVTESRLVTRDGGPIRPKVAQIWRWQLGSQDRFITEERSSSKCTRWPGDKTMDSQATPRRRSRSIYTVHKVLITDLDNDKTPDSDNCAQVKVCLRRVPGTGHLET